MAKTIKKLGSRKLRVPRLILLISAFIALIAIGAAAGVITSMMKGMPAWDPKALSMSASSTVFDKDGKQIATIHGGENRVPIAYEKIPPHVRDAFLAIEDTKFFDHHGISIRGIARALLRDVQSSGSAQGGSTITQQLAKLAFLSPEKKLKRKVQEAILAIRMENEYTKEEILEMYLNRIYFGHGAYGVEMASHTYFNKSVTELNLQEAALLAAIPKSPVKYSPFNNPQNAKDRRNLVLENMAVYEFMGRDKVDAAKKTPLKLNKGKKVASAYKYPYFIDHVIEEVTEKYGNQMVFKGGLKIYTTLDPKIQEEAEKAMANPKNYPKSKKDKNGIIQPQGACVILEPSNGYIRALVGGREHTQQRGFNRATDAKRQPGSAFKPVIAYGPALEKGKSPAFVIDDAPIQYGSWKPRNADGKFRGLTTLRKGLTSSVNIVAIKLLKNIGISTGYKFAEKLGISTLNAKTDENLSIALGGLTEGVYPLELAGAYGAYANGGMYVEPTVIVKVIDRTGSRLEFKQKKKVVMKETTAWLMTDMLKNVVTSGTGTRAQFGGWPIAGKTGTTSKGVDIWFAGYTPKLLGVVYIGYDEPKPMPHAFGGIYPAKIWRQVMKVGHEGLKKAKFERPPGIVSVQICTASGHRPGPNCPPSDIKSEYFARGTVPSKTCDIHVKVEICSASGKLATDYCPSTTFKSFLKPDASNANTQGIPTETCTIHGPGSFVSIHVCTDPRHNGKKYLANLPDDGQNGGCPEQFVKEEFFSPSNIPKEHCPLEDHLVIDIAPPPGKEEEEEQ